MNPVNERDDRHRYGRKPWGGFWTSTYLGENGSDWVRWCEGEDFDDTNRSRWWILRPASDAPVLRIDSWSDFDAIEQRYAVQLYPEIPHDLKTWNFLAMAADGFAGVHLTKMASIDLHYGRGATMEDLNSWDCESTVWFQWLFDEPYQPAFAAPALVDAA